MCKVNAHFLLDLCHELQATRVPFSHSTLILIASILRLQLSYSRSQLSFCFIYFLVNFFLSESIATVQNSVLDFFFRVHHDMHKDFFFLLTRITLRYPAFPSSVL